MFHDKHLKPQELKLNHKKEIEVKMVGDNQE
jgi:hypothetical protein